MLTQKVKQKPAVGMGCQGCKHYRRLCVNTRKGLPRQACSYMETRVTEMPVAYRCYLNFFIKQSIGASKVMKN